MSEQHRSLRGRVWVVVAMLAMTTLAAFACEKPDSDNAERHHLPDSAGMLFVYPTMQSDSSAFWMFRTRIPLDIAFIDSGGTVRSIQHMVPCATTLAQGCPTYPAGARFLAALEVNAGYFDKHGVRIGDRVVLKDSSSRPGGGTRH